MNTNLTTTDYSSKVVDFSVDVTAIWNLQNRNLYNSKNFAALAVRESLQNSIDAVLEAERKGQIAAGEGYIKISVNGDNLVISDNGIGMDIPTIHDKFLTLGGTTKGNDSNVGGFGIAKSVILGCGTGFKVHTRDNEFSSRDLGKNPIKKVAPRQGTKITLYEAQTGDKTKISDNPDKFFYAIYDYILSSEISVPVYINGKQFQPYFVRTPRSRRTPASFGIDSSMIPDKTKLVINVFKVDDDSRPKYLYVRLRGLTQFKTYLSWNANCDVVIDFQTKLDPRDVDYPFSTNREGLKAQYQGIIDAIRDKVTKSPTSISNNDQFRETFYDNVSKEAASARAITSSVSHGGTSTIATQVSKLISGMIPQGGVITPSVADMAQQYNAQLEDIAAETGMTKQEVIKSLSNQTVSKVDNPLKYSWLVWEEKTNTQKLNKSRAISVIMVWDAILRLMASNYKGLENTVFYPGLIVKTDTLGMCVEKDVEGSSRGYVMLNPLEIKHTDDTELALYLMGVAAHELAHFSCDCFEAHGETFSYTREAIMNANLGQLNNVIKLIKAGKLKMTLKKLVRKEREKAVSNCTINFKKLTLPDVEETAERYGIDINDYYARYGYSNKVYRTQLVMAIKKQF